MSSQFPKLILTVDTIYWERGYGIRRLSPGEYPLSQLPREAHHVVLSVNGVSGYLLFEDGTTKPSTCMIESADPIAGIRKALESYHTNSSIYSHGGNTAITWH